MRAGTMSVLFPALPISHNLGCTKRLINNYSVMVRHSRVLARASCGHVFSSLFSGITLVAWNSSWCMYSYFGNWQTHQGMVFLPNVCVVAQSCPILYDPMDCRLPFSRGSSLPRDQAQVSCLQVDSLLSKPPGKVVVKWWPERHGHKVCLSFLYILR